MRKRHLKKLPIPGLAAMLLAGCASDPIIDNTSVDPVAYQKDLEECEQVAQQVRTAATVGKSTMFAAAFGAALGAITGNAARGAGTGAVSGAAGGVLNSDEEKSTVVKNCLRQRGYKVLN